VNFFREIRELMGMLRGFGRLRRASGAYRSALALRRRGNVGAAFEAAQRAVELFDLPSLGQRSAPALTVALPATELLHELAVLLGREAISRAAIVDALGACDLAIARYPGFAEVEYIRSHMARFRERLGPSATAPL
jgi:hypothetical protein